MEKEELSAHSKTVAKGSFWGLAGTVFIKLISFVYLVVLARMAAQDDVGVFQLALRLVSVIFIFSDLGISGAFIRYIPYFEGKGEKGKIRSLIKISYTYLLLLSLLIMAVVFLAADFIGDLYQMPKLPEAIRIMSAYLILGGLFRLNYLYLQGMADIARSQFFQNLQNFLKLVFTLAFFYLLGASVFTISIAFILSVLVALIFSSLTVFRDVRSIPATTQQLGRKELLEEVIPLGAMIAVLQYFSILIYSSDSLILGYLTDPSKSAEIVAVYSMATAFGAVLIAFPVAVGGIFLPLISRLAGKNDMNGVREIIGTTQRWAMFITLPIGIVLIAFSSELIRIFFGSQYSSGSLAMSIFTLGVLCNAVTYIISLTLAALRLVRLELYATAAGGILNVLFSFLLIPLLGIEGAAIASLIGFAVTSLFFIHYGKSILNFKNPPETYTLLIAAFFTLVLIAILQPYLSSVETTLPQFGTGDFAFYSSKALYLAYVGILVTLSFVLFLLFSLLLKCFRTEDVSLMRRALERARLPEALISFAERIASHGISVPKK